MDGTQGTGDAPGRGGDEHGWAEVVVLVLFAALIGFAFLWALVLHEKPADEDSGLAAAGTPAVTLTPPTLPRPHRYEVDGGVNVRKSPAANSELLTKLEDGAKVRVICRTEGQSITGEDGSTNLWLRIDLGSFGIAYASALYVDVGDDLEDPTRIGDCLLAPPG